MTPRHIPRHAFGVLFPIVLIVAGCGGYGTPNASPTNGTLTISPATISVDTNCNGCTASGGTQFTATLKAGGAAAVNWTVSGGDAQAGPGTIDATGLYTPPSYLSQDSAPVAVRAVLQSNPSSSVTAVASVTPGFLLPLTPENAAVGAGSSLTVNGSIAELGGGTIHWALSTSPATVAAPGSTLGSLTAGSCQHSSQSYTTCVVTYTAPTPAPAPAPPLYVVGTVNSGSSTSALHLLLNVSGINSSGLTNQAIQMGAISLGSSGGNDNDYDLATSNTTGQQSISDCCGGTLGSLIQDNNGNAYILSNNHVLAMSDQAALGTSIDQPGLIDGGCTPYGQSGATVRPVAVLSSYVPIGNSSTNADVAIAKIAAGSVDPAGGILQLGAPGANGLLAAAPPAGGVGEAVTAANVSGLQVVKSGRTTGLTCSAINSVSMNISVDYFKDCAETIPYYTKTYTNQITISGNGFSDSGDSGSLVLDASNAQPVGLFYAGGAGLSVANPIADVFNALSTQAATGGATFSFPANPTHAVSCLDYDQNTVTPALKRAVADAAIANAQTVASTSAEAIVNAKAGILGVATGSSIDNPGEATVIVYTDKSKQNVIVPATIGGVRTQVVPADAAIFARGNAPTTQAVTENINLPASVLTAAISVKEQNWRQIVKDPAFFGVGVSQSHDNPNEAALLVLVDQKRTPLSMPATVGGVRVRYMYLDRLHVSRSKYAGSAHPSACAIKSIVKAKEASQKDGALILSTPTSLQLP